ncbi:hypothetical protein DRW41_17810 [Neobacillus piezotolerans]|uniref:Uncharacterized protein n=1 Tax=Neobacillus piezotolerans TaxID=2259171 RepID=A0A3D8GMY1_9BACI|nr:hypothetical protein [Neobacillus piezotolerans]RDU35589.1 hypothetical protein DRW41_17810 [Neobacillus piezotolerans]
MKKKLIVIGSNIEDGRLVLKTREPVAGLAPKGQMLVDSDNLSFVYLMEKDDEYTYVLMPVAVWEDLKKGLDKSLPVYLEDGGSTVELYGIYEELSYLAENIKGNGNYGEAMVSKVESIF